MDQQPNYYSVTLSLTPELAEGLHQLFMQIPMGVIEPVVLSFRKQIDEQKAKYVESLAKVSPVCQDSPAVEEGSSESSDLRGGYVRDVLCNPSPISKFEPSDPCSSS